MEIEVDVVRRMVREQLPQWADLPVTPVHPRGHDNRTFRLGAELVLRLPSHASYVPGILKEDTVLPLLGKHLEVTVPAPVAVGRPDREYPFPWSVRRWIVGQTPDTDPALDRARFAHDLGGFLRELRGVPAGEGPAAGAHSFYRGCHPSVYGDQVQAALTELRDQVDVDACTAIWLSALRSAWASAPVWLHGDVAVGNLLTVRGQLSAVIDFGTCAVGDPACDLVIAWTFLTGDERGAFREAAAVPADTWARARGWALWKALVTVAGPQAPDRVQQRAVLEEVLADPLDP